MLNIIVSNARRRSVPDVPQDVDFLMEHLNDPNYDLYSESRSLLNSSTEVFDLERKDAFDVGSVRLAELDGEFRSDSMRHSIASKTDSKFEYNDESPYAEVRAAVTNVDDPTIPVNTFRTWSLGLFFAIISSSFSQVFIMRYPAVSISAVLVQLATFPCGKALERALPTTRFRTFGYTWSLNPGPFSIKEHVLITVMTNVAISGAYSTDLIATQRIFYNQTVSLGYQLALIISTQMIGFSFSGVLRRFLVRPNSMIWPGALVNATLFNTLHRTYGKPDRHISRHKFFFIVMACSSLYYILPGYLWTGLSIFNWVCWIAPNNVVVNNLFGSLSGLGMGVFTFDWAMISYFANPLTLPWWAEANTGAGFILFFWIIAPILYYTNSFWMSYLPISSSRTFDNAGNPYDPSRIITNDTFDLAKYEAYSPAFLPTTLALAYGIAFASFTAIIVHTFLWYRHDIMKRLRNNLEDEHDVHSRLMQVYPEVPQWWYVALGIVATILLFVAAEVYPTGLPIWAACFGLLLSAIVAVPAGMVQAITNQSIGFNVMFEFLAGYLLSGKPVAVMFFKAITTASVGQAVGFSGSLKLGHYMKIPPRMIFLAQSISTLVVCFTVTLVQDWMLTTIVDICQPHQPQFFTCPSVSTFASASLLWGGIGPQRIFSVGAMYGSFLWFFALGAILPIPFYYLARRFPLSYWRYINIPVLLSGLDAIPVATGQNYSSWLITAFFFQWFMRRYHFRWWMRYNYILAAGLDAGVALGLVLISSTLQLPNGGITFNWWGNTVWQNTADALGTPLRVLPPGQTFGPSKW